MPKWSVTIIASGSVTGFAEIEVEAASEAEAKTKALELARNHRDYEPDDAGVEWMGPYSVDEVCFVPPPEKGRRR
jgi:hypothetical protein